MESNYCTDLACCCQYNSKNYSHVKDAREKAQLIQVFFDIEA